VADPPRDAHRLARDPKSSAARLLDRAGIVGRPMYALSVAGLGAMLVTAKFVYVWAPIAAWVPGRSVLAVVAGAAMLLSAAGLAWRRTAARASAALAVLFLCWLLLLQLPKLVGAPSHEGLWAGAGQIGTAVAGGWLLFVSLGSGGGLRSERAVRTARAMFAVALPFFGIHHFHDLAGAAEAVPAWLPFPVAWAAATGAAHVAAGVAMVLGIVPRLAAALEALMVTAFVLLVHVPGIARSPRDGAEWSMFFVAAVIGGAGWIVARSYARTGDALRP
jgi:uncharacterized membrane protein